MKLSERGGLSYARTHLKSLARYGGLPIGLGILILVLALVSDRFFTIQNGLNIVRQASINGVLALGMTMVVLTAGIDLSVGSLLGITAMIQAMLLTSGVPTVVTLLLGVACGALLGGLNGVLVTRIKIPPFIATLGTMVMLRGLTLIISGGKPITGLPDSFRYFGAGTVGIFPVPIIIMIVLYGAAALVLRRTVVGERIYTIGDNTTAARYANIPVKTYTTLAYVVSGVMCVVAGIMLIGRLNSAQPTIGQGYELDAIAALVIGGVSLSGGVGSVGGTFTGVIIISVINNAMNILNVPSFYQQIFKGGIIIFSLLMRNVMRRNQ